METGGPTAIEIILWVLAANAILILTAYGLVKLLKRKSEESIVQIGEQIQAHDARLSAITDYLQSYGGINQEPFSTPLDELQKEASDLQERLNRFLAACRAFEEDMRTPGRNRMQDIINAPFNWLRHWRYSKELARESSAISDQLSAAEGIIQRINELPWELSTQVRQLEKDAAELVQIARALQSKGLRGHALMAVISQIPDFERALSRIPHEFLTAEHNELLAAANSDATIRVFQVYHSIHPTIAQYLPQVRDWQTHYQKATADYTEMKQSGANLRQSLLHAPENMLIDPIQTRLDQVAQLASEINQRLAQPDVQELRPLAREVAHLRKVLLDAEQQFARAGRQLDELGQALEELSIALEKVSAQFAAAEHTESHPLVWDESGSALNELHERLHRLGHASQPRTPDQIAQHIKETESIRSGHRLLAEKAPHVVEQHRALLSLLDSSEVRDGAAWLRKTREMLAQTSAYDPRNWPKADSIATLPSEIEELARAHERLVPADHTAPIRESKLAQRLQDTQGLAALHKALRPRVESVRARLEKLRAMEEEGKEKLTAAWTALERVALLDENNELLAEIAAAEIERLGEEIRTLGNELNVQGKEEVEKKLQKINALSDKVTRALNSWLARLNTAIAERGKQVQERLAQVENMVNLEDVAIQEARNLLAREDFSSVSPAAAPEKSRGVARLGAAALGAVTHRSAPDPNLNILEATAEIKRKNDLWLTLLMIQTALEEKSAPVLVAYEEVVQARTEARECLAELGQRLPEGKRLWPPNNQNPLTESQALQPVDSKWEAMRKQRGRADWAVQEMKRLAQQYKLTADRARQVAARVEEDHERIMELEWQVENLKQKWQAQATADPNNPVIREGVQQLMTQTDSQMAFIKTQYMRGVITYEQVIHNLQLLIDEIFSARVPLDEQTDIGLNEAPHSAERSNGRQSQHHPHNNN